MLLEVLPRVATGACSKSRDRAMHDVSRWQKLVTASQQDLSHLSIVSSLSCLCLLRDKICCSHSPRTLIEYLLIDEIA